MSQLLKQKKRILPINDVMNFRDLGGYTNDQGQQVKWHLLYRSAQLDRLQANSIKQIQSLGIKTIVDLRFFEESKKYPTVQEAFPHCTTLSWYELEKEVKQASVRAKLLSPEKSWRDSLASKKPEVVRNTMRDNYPRRLYTHAVIYQHMLHHIINHKTPLLFHCAAGKDRTGIAAALILSLLGVPSQQIIEDYLITQQELSHKVETWLAGGAADDSERYKDMQYLLEKHPREVVQPVFDADPIYITHLLEYVDSEYGDFHHYAKKHLAFGEKEVAQLRACLLEPIETA